MKKEIIFKERQFILSTIMDEGGVSIQMFPFFKYKSFSWDAISNAYIRKYNPIAEYGGWGVRDGWFKFKIFMTKAIRVDDTNIAYNISGNIGLQLKLINDKRVLIGTRKSTKMEDVLRKLGKWKEE